MNRRTLLFGAGGWASIQLFTKGLLSAQTQNAQVLKFIRDRQEREYVRLADALKLDSAKSAYEKTVNRPVSKEVEQQYRSQPLPTPFEDPYMYAILKNGFSAMSREVDLLKAPPLPHPVLATLPSGDVEARITEEPTTGTQIVFFEQGLFLFFYDFAKLMAWASPPLRDDQLNDDAALGQVPRKYTMPTATSAFFAGCLNAYAMSGSPLGSNTPIPEPTHNLALAIRLAEYMSRFVLAHELVHILAGHGGKHTPELEYEADANSVLLVTTLADKFHGSWALGYWGAELALIALNFLYRAIAILTYGNDSVTWINPTHPDPLARRQNLRSIWLNPRSPKDGVAAARDMCGMTEALLQRLWELGSAVLLLEYQDGKRASPRWGKTGQYWKPKVNLKQ